MCCETAPYISHVTKCRKGLGLKQRGSYWLYEAAWLQAPPPPQLSCPSRSSSHLALRSFCKWRSCTSFLVLCVVKKGPFRFCLAVREQSSQRKKGKQAGHTTLQIHHLARELPSIASLGSSSFCRSFLSLPIPTRVLVAAGQASRGTAGQSGKSRRAGRDVVPSTRAHSRNASHRPLNCAHRGRPP